MANPDSEFYLPPDLHTHSVYCGHARGTMEANIKQAIELGLAGIGFTGHFPYPEGYREPVADAVIPADKFPDFLQEVFALREKYTAIPVYFAVEIDYIEGFMNKTQEKLSELPVDYIMGSVHIIKDVMVDHSEEMLNKNMDTLGGHEGIWDSYWNGLEALIQLDLCDIISHLDLPKKFLQTFNASMQYERIDQILTLIKEKDLILEVNSGGVDRAIENEPYPSRKILEMAFDKKIEITLGSDAHCPGEVGRYFPQMIELIQAIGWRTLVYYENREKRYFYL